MTEETLIAERGETDAAAPVADWRTRRTFAIISHPDAGKTTLTEKLLLKGGAIRMAGAVRARGEQRRTRSDWMAIERERGISVSSTVMRFERDGLVFNLLDTPGHEDFSEDTYRTLTAVDSAIMVIDAAKGIETQTRKLFEVCRLRDIPIVTFINKIDREGRHPFELLDQIQSELALDTAPVTWPIGMGTDFSGVADLQADVFLTSSHGRGGAFDLEVKVTGLDDPKLLEHVSPPVLTEYRDQVALASDGYPQFLADSFLEGHLTPVIFGSALRGYSVEELLRLIAEHAPPPRPQPTSDGVVTPGGDDVSGFVFKVQANMDPNHRDRIAFMRLCSGKLRRGMKLTQVRTGKALTVHSPVLFFGQDRHIADDAVAGDVVGIPNHGALRVGDTLAEDFDHALHRPPLVRAGSAPPRAARRLEQGEAGAPGADGSRRGRAGAGFSAADGRALDGRRRRHPAARRAEITHRRRIRRRNPAGVRPYQMARWVVSKDGKEAIETFRAENGGSLAEDRDGRLVYLARNSWDLDNIIKRYPGVAFRETVELAS